ncbi:MAG: hypothetical protein AAF797_05650 [Planctomycetota bacterium]
MSGGSFRRGDGGVAAGRIGSDWGQPGQGVGAGPDRDALGQANHYEDFTAASNAAAPVRWT